jgi:arabinofuranosyltransferase
MKSAGWKWGIAVALFILVAGAIIHTAWGASGFVCGHAWGNDDAFISYQYARNLVKGRGLAFNPGERVEGYSNFLYVLLVAPAFFVTTDDGVYFYSVFFNLVFTIGAFLIFTSHLRHELGNWNAAAGCLLFALCLPIWIAVASGLETCLVLLLYLAIWVTVERVARDPDARHVNLLWVLLVLSVLTRADGFVVPGMVIFYLVIKRRFREAVTCALAAFAAFGAYEAWRYHYYGHFLPNTYYVKVAGPLPERLSNALSQLGKIVFVTGLLGYLLAFLFVIVEAGRRIAGGSSRIFNELRFDILFAVGWTAYWFYIGGDHFLERFLLPLFPLGIFALLKYLQGNASASAVAYLLVLFGALEVGPNLAVDSRFNYAFSKHDCWITLGKFLGAKYAGQTLATSAIGKMPFFSGLYTIDMLGLIDPVIAHGPIASKGYDPGHVKFDPDYVLSRKPDLIADWIVPSLDMSYGLARAKYERAGYHVAYLIGAEGACPLGEVVEVSGLDRNALGELIKEGYKYGVLVRSNQP